MGHPWRGFHIFHQGELLEDLVPTRELVHAPPTQFMVGGLQDFRDDTEDVV